MERLRRAALGWAVAYPALHLVLCGGLAFFGLAMAVSGRASAREIGQIAAVVLVFGGLGILAVVVASRARWRPTRGGGLACVGLAAAYALGMIAVALEADPGGGWLTRNTVWVIIPVLIVPGMFGAPVRVGGVIAGSYAAALGLGGWLTLRRAV